MHVKIAPLAGILKLFGVLVFIYVAVVAKQSVLLLELLGGLLTDSVGLFGEGLDPHVRVEGSPVVDEFEDVAFLQLFSNVHCIKIIGCF